jgi:uncharacterized protein RhaS with RHS repeats
MYDPVLTSFLTVDPLCEMYYSISPYAYCGNNPVNAIDPNGKLVIFINGMHFENGGTRDYWDKNGGGFATAVMNHLQDWNDDYIDGSHGGKRSFPWNNSTTDRMDVGFKKGESYARTFRILYKNEDGSFKESIKIITHSMGAAYAKGFIKGLIAGGIPIDLVEFEADFAPYQPKKQEAIEGVKTYQFSHSKDWVAGNDKMNGAEYIDTSSDQNQTHWIEDFRDQIQNLPEGKYRIENGRIVPY